MKKLRAYYERELGTMKGLNVEFAAEYPAQARLLGMEDGNADDPHIERFAQATALSNARTAQLIDDNDAKVTEALLQVNFPHYLQPFPSTGILCVDMLAGMDKMTTVGVIPRGTMVDTKIPNTPACRFQTVFDVPLTPVALSAVQFHPFIDLPLSLPRTAGVTGTLSIDIECKAPSLDFAQLKLAAVRPFINAEQSLCATTRDVLFLHAKSAYIEPGDGGDWVALQTVPIKPVGFAPLESLIPYPASSHPAYRLLTEYFVAPEKFHFFDIDWHALAPHLPVGCRRLTLHLGLAGVPADSHVARSLSQLSSKNFVLGCTPVINLFKRSACPIELTHAAPDYELIPDGSPADAYDIHSVDKVYSVRESRHGQTLTEFRPYYSLRHGEAGGRLGCYYLVRRDRIKALSHPGHEMRISLVDLDLDPLAIPNASVSIDLTCTNRDLPSRLRYSGTSELTMEQATAGYPLRFLRKPTPQYRFSADAHWRLISHLSLSHCSLAPDALDRLKETLTLYDLPQSAVSQRQIAGIVALDHLPARSWLRQGGHSCLVHGIEVRVTLDEDAFAGTGLHLFAQVLDHFFGLYVHLNSYSQLTILSQASGKELMRCQPRSGGSRSGPIPALPKARDRTALMLTYL